MQLFQSCGGPFDRCLAPQKNPVDVKGDTDGLLPSAQILFLIQLQYLQDSSKESPVVERS